MLSSINCTIQKIVQLCPIFSRWNILRIESVIQRTFYSQKAFSYNRLKVLTIFNFNITTTLLPTSYLLLLKYEREIIEKFWVLILFAEDLVLVIWNSISKCIFTLESLYLGRISKVVCAFSKVVNFLFESSIIFVYTIWNYINRLIRLSLRMAYI